MLHEAEVRENDPLDSWTVRAVDLELIYPSNGLQAVSPLTFGLRQGSVLGLLGPNGAGKSSTFSMLSMKEARSSGDAELIK